MFTAVDLAVYWRNLLLVLILTALWTLPILTWFLFCSSWSKRTPFIAALAIPLVIILLDHILSFGIHLGGLIADRIPFGYSLGSGDGGFLIGLHGITTSHAHRLAFSELFVFFRQAELWFGLVVAAGFTAATIWIRRWRDDS